MAAYKISTDSDGKKTIGKGVRFERIRRITGYLVGDTRTRFNDAKRAEERDRVKHGLPEKNARCEKE